jgi:hypothetical protein
MINASNPIREGITRFHMHVKMYSYHNFASLRRADRIAQAQQSFGPLSEAYLAGSQSANAPQ